MATQTLDPTAATSAPTRQLKPGIYRGGSAAEFGLWRLRADGVWLFCVPVEGETWKRAGDQNPGDSLILLVDETRIRPRRHPMKVVNNLTLRPGIRIEIAGSLSGDVTKIGVVAYDKFRISLDEHDPSVGFDVDTRGFRRTPEDVDEVEELPLTELTTSPSTE